jgi:hypothetical protein
MHIGTYPAGQPVQGDLRLATKQSIRQVRVPTRPNLDSILPRLSTLDTRSLPLQPTTHSSNSCGRHSIALPCPSHKSTVTHRHPILRAPVPVLRRICPSNPPRGPLPVHEKPRHEPPRGPGRRCPVGATAPASTFAFRCDNSSGRRIPTHGAGTRRTQHG